MKNSKQRDLILSIINNSYDHKTAYEIYNEARKSIDNISLGTIYRNLNLLIENGLIKKIKVLDDIDRYDKANDDHSHFICTKCHNIYDIKKEDENRPNSIEGHKIINLDIMYSGICKNCLKEEEK